MSDDDGVLLYAYRGCLFRVPDGVQLPKAGSRFFSRHLVVRAGERLLEIGGGLGLTAVVAARAGASVVATDVLPVAVEAMRINAALNGVVLDARLGDCYAPVAADEHFHVIGSNPPQMPTPAGRSRDDETAAADNGGVDGWEILDRLIAGAPARLSPGGRLLFTIFGFLGEKSALAKLEAHGLTPAVVARETQAFPRIGYERLDHIRSLDGEGTITRTVPAAVERLMIQGTLANG